METHFEMWFIGLKWEIPLIEYLLEIDLKWI